MTDIDVNLVRAPMAGLSSPDPEGIQARFLVQVLADPLQT